MNETKSNIAAKEREIKESDGDLERLEAKLKVEKRIFGTKGIKAEFKNNVKYSIEALESMLMMEENKNAGLKGDVETEKYRLKVIGTFTAGEL